jgi:hypothetical protein
MEKIPKETQGDRNAGLVINVCDLHSYLPTAEGQKHSLHKALKCSL